MATDNPHFERIEDWEEAESRLGFAPLRPVAEPISLNVHVMDHKQRRVEPTLEASFDGYVLSQALRDPAEAGRLARRRYGSDPFEIVIAGHDGLAYELGPQPVPGDMDPRPPAVVTWADDGLFVLVASDSMTVMELIEIARSLYPPHHEPERH